MRFFDFDIRCRYIVSVYKEERRVIVGKSAVKGMESGVLRAVIHNFEIAVIVAHLGILEKLLLFGGQLLAVRIGQGKFCVDSFGALC